MSNLNFSLSLKTSLYHSNHQIDIQHLHKALRSSIMGNSCLWTTGDYSALRYYRPVNLGIYGEVHAVSLCNEKHRLTLASKCWNWSGFCRFLVLLTVYSYSLGKFCAHLQVTLSAIYGMCCNILSGSVLENTRTSLLSFVMPNFEIQHSTFTTWNSVAQPWPTISKASLSRAVSGRITGIRISQDMIELVVNYHICGTS